MGAGGVYVKDFALEADAAGSGEVGVHDTLLDAAAVGDQDVFPLFAGGSK
jgi:hypothetical protein